MKKTLDAIDEWQQKLDSVELGRKRMQAKVGDPNLTDKKRRTLQYKIERALREESRIGGEIRKLRGSLPSRIIVDLVPETS